MSKKLRNYLKRNPDAELDFGLSINNSKVRMRDDGTFTLSWKSSKSHTWHSANGKSGKVSAKYLSRRRNWIKATGDKSGMGNLYEYGDVLSSGDNVDHKIVGSIPSKSGHTLFLYESNPIKHKNGRSIIKGRLLSSAFVIDYAEELAYAFGEKAVRNHLLSERSLRKDDSSALKILQRGASSKVTTDFWQDVRQLQKEAKKQIKTDAKKGRYIDANRPSGVVEAISFKSFWDDATDWVDDTAGDIEDAANDVADATEDAADVINETTDDAINDAAEAVDDVIDDAADYMEGEMEEIDNSFISPAQDIIDDTIDDIEDLLDPTGPIVLKDTVKWDLFSDRFEEAPFYAEYDGTATATVEIHLEEGYLGAIDTSTIKTHLIPNIDLSAGAGLELDPLVYTLEGTIDGPERSFPNPTVGEITFSSRFDYEFTATASPGEGVGAGVLVEASPEAELSFKASLSNPDPKLTGIKDGFTFTEDIDRLFKNFNPSGELTATITPAINITALPMIPSDVPTVGGMGLANMGVTYFNPITFKYDTTDPKALNGSVSGYIEPELSVLGQKIGGIPNLDIYEKDFNFSFG